MIGTINSKDTENDGLLFKDVTEEWLEKATPNSHEVLDRNFYVAEDGIKYVVDDQNVILDYTVDEKATAQLLADTFGGEIYMNPRVNKPDGIEAADIFFKGHNWDRKSMVRATSLIRVVDNAIKEHQNQAKRFILDITGCKLNNRIIVKQVENVFSMGKFNRDWVEAIIVVRDNEVIKVYIKEVAYHSSG